MSLQIEPENKMEKNHLRPGLVLTATSGKTYMCVSPLGQPNVYTGIETTSSSNPTNPKIVILKSPNQTEKPPYLTFQNEIRIHSMFPDAKGIRKVVDFVPSSSGPEGAEVKGTSDLVASTPSDDPSAPSSDGPTPPILILEAFSTTLWSARTTRPLTDNEIKTIARGILEGLREIHAKGYVYTDLKMENVLVNNFSPSAEPATPEAASQLEVKLGDLGLVEPPAKGKSQPITYRAPEVYFKSELNRPIDIWAFGLVVCHLLEARSEAGFKEVGMYDGLPSASVSSREAPSGVKGSVAGRERAVMERLVCDYDLAGEGQGYYGDVLGKGGRRAETKEAENPQWNRLAERGLSEREIAFVQWVLQPDPTKRPTVEEILACEWLNGDERGRGWADRLKSWFVEENGQKRRSMSRGNNGKGSRRGSSGKREAKQPKKRPSMTLLWGSKKEKEADKEDAIVEDANANAKPGAEENKNEDALPSPAPNDPLESVCTPTEKRRDEDDSFFDAHDSHDRGPQMATGISPNAAKGGTFLSYH
ncbi:kinase-like protein [Piedraia hortae CBS 480.64]|uniref:Kinase-like protein n=1 Tax=Piedraia hortae CBS 480.64 TaxID=1314780 RepID=A0A6A7BYA5_9PEZI|nr:kinase-like protein [Piedraia hortae CBS 480.64]